jgi:hypothetical protein
MLKVNQSIFNQGVNWNGKQSKRFKQGFEVQQNQVKTIAEGTAHARPSLETRGS